MRTVTFILGICFLDALLKHWGIIKNLADWKLYCLGSYFMFLDLFELIAEFWE